MSNKEKILVTGASGFTGRHLVRRLEDEGYKVITPDHSSGFDVRKQEEVLGLPKADIVIHLAAIVNVPLSWEKPHEVLNVNAGGTLNILLYCSKHMPRLIFASSYAYSVADYFPIDEKHPTRVGNPYAVSKLAGEQLCYVYSKKGGFETTVLRIFNPYGPGQSEKMVISQMAAELVRDGKITIFNGKPKRDLLYISDLVEAYLSVIKSPSGGYHLYNVGYGDSWTIRELAEMLVEISGKEAKVEDKGIERPNEIMDSRADISKIKGELGWSPKIDINEGLQRTYSWYVEETKKK